MIAKVFADTSTLVAAMVESHPAHGRAFPWLERARSGGISLAVATHTLAELYGVLTRLPLQPRIGPSVARRLIRHNVEAVAHVIELNSQDYAAVLDDMAELGLSGGVIYDALAVRAARTWNATRILTLNESDFRRVWPDGDERIATP